jgi:hypothetical protein
LYSSQSKHELPTPAPNHSHPTYPKKDDSLTLYSCCSNSPSFRLLLALAALLLFTGAAATAAVLLLPLLLLLPALPLPLLLVGAGLMLCLSCCVCALQQQIHQTAKVLSLRHVCMSLTTDTAARFAVCLLSIMHVHQQHNWLNGHTDTAVQLAAYAVVPCPFCA